MARGINNIGGGGVDSYNPTYTRKVNYGQTLVAEDLFYAKLEYGLLTTSQPPGISSDYDRSVFDSTETFLATNSGSSGSLEIFRNNFDGTFTQMTIDGLVPDSIKQLSIELDETGTFRVAMQRGTEIRFAIYNSSLDRFEIQSGSETIESGISSMFLKWSRNCEYLFYGYFEGVGASDNSMNIFRRTGNNYSELTYGSSVQFINVISGISWSRERNVCYILTWNRGANTRNIVRLDINGDSFDGSLLLTFPSDEQYLDLEIDLFNKKMLIAEGLGSYLLMYSLTETDSSSTISLLQRIQISAINNETDLNFRPLSRINKDNMIVYLINQEASDRNNQTISCVKIYGDQINVIDTLSIQTLGNSKAYMTTFSENFIVMATASGVKSIPINMNTTKVIANGLVQVISPTNSNIIGVITENGVNGDYKQADILMR